jgi:hypothetical protein
MVEDRLPGVGPVEPLVESDIPQGQTINDLG